MTTHHHHRPGQPHPSPAVPPSLMRLSLGGRFIAVGIVIVLVWTLVIWAIA
ncbi:MAG: hypothetical protein R3D52_04245 [Xanthobacteraceae bacterium]